ncbi:dopamine receptor 1-like isoform X2 [Lycorma delicatula]|uniref:dopamine receptor 1-like isoform X2 n=1 Tax=Lycorma delicatula TaxID=130591 RepID=UPI003F50EF35
MQFCIHIDGRSKESNPEYNWTSTTTTHLPEIAEDLDTLTTLSLVPIGIFLCLLIFLSIAGNILVCLAIYTDRGLRRIGSLFLASLAIADLFVAALVMTFAVVNDLAGYWVFGPQFCDTWIAFDVMCSTASILNLCAISLDRYIHIKDPLRYSRWVTRRVALVSIACIWLLAALISFVPISLGLHRPPQPLVFHQGDTAYPTCALDLTPTYAVVSSCISFYVPCVVMVGIYCRLYCYAQKHVQNIRAVTRPLTSPSIPATMHASSPYHVSDHKAAITVGVIMGTFLLCWVPFFCVNIIAAFCKTCIPGMAFKVLTWLGYSNSAFNPIIYSIFNTEFRDAFRRILTAHYPPCCCGGYSSVTMALREGRKPPDCAGLKVATRQQNGRSSISPRSSIGSLRQTRVNSTDKVVLDEETSAI